MDIVLNPNWIGTDEIRKPLMRTTEKGELLILEPLQALTKRNTNGELIRYLVVLTWERLPDRSRGLRARI